MPNQLANRKFGYENERVTQKTIVATTSATLGEPVLTLDFNRFRISDKNWYNGALVSAVGLLSDASAGYYVSANASATGIVVRPVNAAVGDQIVLNLIQKQL